MQAVANDGQYDGNLPTAQMANSFIGLCTDTVPSEVQMALSVRIQTKDDADAATHMASTSKKTSAKRHLQKNTPTRREPHDRSDGKFFHKAVH